MSDMSIFVVLQQIAPLFIMMAIGIIVGRTGMTDGQFTKTMSQICMNVLFPASIIKSFYAKITPEMIEEGLILILAGGITVLVTFWLAYFFNRAMKITIPLIVAFAEILAS